jgi:hypothetical protein
LTDATYTVPSPEHQRVIRATAIYGGTFFVLTAVAYALTVKWVTPIPRDGTSLVVGRDFLNFWMYGRAAFDADPGRFYDPVTYQRALGELLGPSYLGQNWSYPPSIMLLAAPFGQIGYLAALACWTILGLMVFFSVARRFLDARLAILLALSPAAVLCLASGQSSLITAAMLIAILACLDRAPIAAGVLIGLLSLKPQLGLLFPVMLIACRRWRVLAAAALTTALIVAATAALFGPQVWVDFVMKGIPTQHLVLDHPKLLGAPFMPTVFMNLRAAGASYALAMTVQTVVAVLAVIAVFWAFRSRKDADPLLLAALFLACSVSATPYLLSYDTLPLTFAAVALLAAGKLDSRGTQLAQLVFWLPAIQLVLGTYHLPGPALIPPALAIYLLSRLRTEPAAEQRTADAGRL